MKFLGDSVNPDNLMLVNMIYGYGGKANGYTDSLEIIYKDLKTGKKKLKILKKPEVEIFFTKPEHRDYNHNKAFMELDKTYPVMCKYKDIPWMIAKEAGEQYISWMRELVASGNRRSMNEIYKYRYSFGADMDAESYYRTYWMLEYDNEKPKPLTKGYFDIEVDTIDIVGFPKDGECPINIITFVNDETKGVYTLMLDNPNNDSMTEFKNDIESFIEEAHELFDPVYGVLDYHLFLYEDERELITEFFKLTNTLKPDFIMGWNIFGFDIPYILARCRVLGLDPADIIPHPDFFNKVCRFVKDVNNFDIKNKSDRFELSSYSKYIDHMRLYAATRKGRTELRSFSLNFVGKKEIGDEKIDYSENANIKTLPYKNYRLFVLYNIKDRCMSFFS